MSEILYEETNPHGTVHAVVEVDELTCYFYLYGAEESGFGMKSVWVRNLVSAPEELDRDSMSEGNPPLNPRSHCRNPNASLAPSPDDLGVVWMPEGNAAILYERNEILAIIPSWSNLVGFTGYSRDCIGEGPVAWELNDDNELLVKVDAAEQFWASWDDNSWPNLSDKLIEQIEGALGPHAAYYAIDGGEWPPRALLRIPSASVTYLITMGISILPMPNVEIASSNTEGLDRVELGAVLPAGWADDAIKRFGGYLSGVARMPWKQNRWFGVGHTIPCTVWSNPSFTFALLTDARPAMPRFELSHQYADRIPVLWFLPITDTEQEYAVENGSASLLSTLPADRWQQA